MSSRVSGIAALPARIVNVATDPKYNDIPIQGCAAVPVYIVNFDPAGTDTTLDSLIVGDYAGGNYFEVEADGSVILHGNATLEANAAMQANATLIVGNYTGGNYFYVEADGSVRLYGNATQWRDEFTSLTATRLVSPAGDFVQNDAEGSITAKSSARYPDDFLGMNIQLNHDWYNGSSIHVHIHWWQTTSATPNWLIGYRWQKQLQAKTTAWTLEKWVTNESVWSAGILNQITEFTTIVPPVGYNQVSDILQIKLYRDVTNASLKFGGAEVGLGNMELLHLDAHIQVDAFGSRTEYSK